MSPSYYYVLGAVSPTTVGGMGTLLGGRYFPIFPVSFRIALLAPGPAYPAVYPFMYRGLVVFGIGVFRDREFSIH
jgi:hypothetical protein